MYANNFPKDEQNAKLDKQIKKLHIPFKSNKIPKKYILWVNVLCMWMGEHVLIGLKHDSTKIIQEVGTAGSLDLPGGPSAWTWN